MREDLGACLVTEEVALLAGGEAQSAKHPHLLSHIESCEACRTMVGAALRAARSDTAPAAAHDELNVGTRVGRYVIVGWLGAGGMGRVYSAHDPELARTIALKVLRASPSAADAESYARLAREAQLTARLSHPNVVAVHDVGIHEGRVFVAMELVEGETLRAWLRAEPRGWRAITSVFQQAGRGIAAAHAAGIVHRDIKPD
ncbi:MAG: protein kinase, partial [Myxococcota bacterium]|nr:protein kinase [Myxococcota bacterium]